MSLTMSLSPFTRLLAAVLAAALIQGCSVMSLPDNLPYGVLNNDDMKLVGEGLPSYMLMVDGMIVNWPESESLLRSGAGLYSAYAGLYVRDEDRARKLTDRAMDYALRAACAHDGELCEVRDMPVPELEELVGDMDEGDLPTLYTLGSTWAGYIQQNSSDWNAIAELARVELIMERVVAVEPGYEHGQGHMYLGVLDSILPASLGGKPEQARVHFSQAIELSGGRNLLAKTLYAEKYARLVFDRELHDRLLNEVLEADPHEHGLTLQNIYAQKEARRLLDSADDYF